MPCLAPAAAQAKAFITQGGNIPRGQIYLSPMLGLGFDNFVEAGFAGSYMLVPHGFVPQINNSVHAEGTIFQDLVGRDRTGAFGGRMRWDFHPHPQWSPYAAPGFAFRFGDDDRHTGLEVTGVVGGFFHVNESISLRAETDLAGFYDHAGIRGGVAFRL